MTLFYHWPMSGSLAYEEHVYIDTFWPLTIYCSLNVKSKIRTIINFPLCDYRVSLVSQRVKASVCNVGDLGLIPRSGRFPGEGNDNLLQYSYLGNPMDRGA